MYEKLENYICHILNNFMDMADDEQKRKAFCDKLAANIVNFFMYFSYFMMNFYMLQYFGRSDPASFFGAGIGVVVLFVLNRYMKWSYFR